MARRKALPLALFLLATPLLPLHASSISRVQGRVTDEDGKPLPKVKVTLAAVDEAARGIGGSTDRRGEFLIGIVQPGRYRVVVDEEQRSVRHVSARALGPNRAETWKQEGDVRPGQPIELLIGQGDVVTCDLVLSRPDAGGGKADAERIASREEELGALEARIQGGDCAGALPKVDEILASAPSVPRALFLSAYCRVHQDRFDEAASRLDRLLEIEPAFPGAALLKGQLERRQGKRAEAEALFRQEIANAGTSQATRAESWLSLGILLREEGREADATAALDSAISVDPKRAEPYGQLSDLYASKGKLELAQATLDRAPAGPGLSTALLNLGIGFFNRKECSKAEGMFRRVIAEGGGKQELSLAYGLLGRCLSQGGQTSDALAALRKSLEIDPDGKIAGENRKLIDRLTAGK